MNLQDIASIIQFVRKQTPCPHCKKRYGNKDISIIASARNECLLELKCSYCKKLAVTDVVSTPQNPAGTKREKPTLPLINQIMRDGITDNDVLDVKNFLSNFDGDFKKIFM